MTSACSKDTLKRVLGTTRGVSLLWLLAIFNTAYSQSPNDIDKPTSKHSCWDGRIVSDIGLCPISEPYFPVCNSETMLFFKLSTPSKTVIFLGNFDAESHEELSESSEVEQWIRRWVIPDEPNRDYCHPLSVEIIGHSDASYGTASYINGLKGAAAAKPHVEQIFGPEVHVKISSEGDKYPQVRSDDVEFDKTVNTRVIIRVEWDMKYAPVTPDYLKP